MKKRLLVYILQSKYSRPHVYDSPASAVEGARLLMLGQGARATAEALTRCHDRIYQGMSAAITEYGTPREDRSVLVEVEIIPREIITLVPNGQPAFL